MVFILSGEENSVLPMSAAARGPQSIPNAAVQVVYEDEWYVVVNKPSGILVHPTAGPTPEDTEFLIYQAAAAVGEVCLFPVHRLDRGTSGLIVLAKSSAACAALQAIWSDVDGEKKDSEHGRRRVVKQYICCVDGCIEDRIHCMRPLNRRPTLAEKRKSRRRRDGPPVCAQPEGCGEDRVTAKGAKTSDLEGEDAVEGLEEIPHAVPDVPVAYDQASRRTQECSTTFVREGALWVHNGSPRVSLVRCELQTGRRHQIRRHLAGLGYAIFGDDAYGKTRINAWLRKDFGLERIFLHAARLEFDHPFREEVRVELTCPLPVELAEFLQRLPNSNLDQFSPLVMPT